MIEVTKEQTIEFIKYFLDLFPEVPEDISDENYEKHIRQKYPTIPFETLNLNLER